MPQKSAPGFGLEKPPPYEYEYKKWPIDILSGDDFLRKWVENPHSSIQDFEDKLQPDEKLWPKSEPLFCFIKSTA